MKYNEDTVKKKQNRVRSKRARLLRFVTSTTFRIILMILVVGLALSLSFLYGAWEGIKASTPDDIDLTPQTMASFIYDDQGNKIQELYDYESNRFTVTEDQIPDNLKNAFIAIEDERFYDHHGVDYKGIVRALWNDITHRTSRQGASTITQQLIKNNVFGAGGERHFPAKVRRKLMEQYMAIKAEKMHSKEWILTNYLNTINLGRGNLGVQAASRYYFNKDVSELTLSECAVLAGITKNPSMLNPQDYPEQSQERTKLVLKKMNELNHITETQYQEALKDDVYTRISESVNNRGNAKIFSYFTDAVITQVVEDLEEQKGYSHQDAFRMVYRGGLQIYSTQNTQMQQISDKIINDKNNYPRGTKFSLEYELTILHPDGTENHYSEKDLQNYIKGKNKNEVLVLYDDLDAMNADAAKFSKAMTGEGDTVKEEIIHYSKQPQLSYTLIESGTGQVKVLVGGRGQKQDNLALNRATDVKRQPGSTFKILSTYAPGIDSGELTLATTFDDAPYKYENGTPIHNFIKDEYKGLTTIRDAIADSNNIVAVKSLTRITPQVGFDFLKKMGFTTLVDRRTNTDGETESDINQSLSLGGITDGVTNIELTAAYASIANKGSYNRPILYTEVKDKNGNVLLKNETQPKEVMKPTTAWLLTDAMKDVVDHGTGVEAKLNTKMGVAGKTGTSSNNYDYWFSGFTPYYTASIWTGYDYNTSFENKRDYHKIIWRKIMNQIIDAKQKEQPVKDFDACAGIEKTEICMKSGKKPIAGTCSRDPEKSMVRSEYFAEGTKPKASCDAHISVTLCGSTDHVITRYCPKKHIYTRVFRIRPKKAKGTTDDSKYALTFDPKSYYCPLHTKTWYKKKQEEKKKKELEKKKLQQQQKMQQQQQTLPQQPVTGTPLE